MKKPKPSTHLDPTPAISGNFPAANTEIDVTILLQEDRDPAPSFPCHSPPASISEMSSTSKSDRSGKSSPSSPNRDASAAGEDDVIGAATREALSLDPPLRVCRVELATPAGFAQSASGVRSLFTCDVSAGEAFSPVLPSGRRSAGRGGPGVASPLPASFRGQTLVLLLSF